MRKLKAYNFSVKYPACYLEIQKARKEKALHIPLLLQLKNFF